MSSFSIKFINGFQDKKLSKLIKYYHSFFNSFFPLYYLMLKQYSYSFYKELFFLILEYLNLFKFLFREPVSFIFIMFFLNKIVFIYMEEQIYGTIMLYFKICSYNRIY